MRSGFGAVLLLFKKGEGGILFCKFWKLFRRGKGIVVLIVVLVVVLGVVYLVLFFIDIGFWEIGWVVYIVFGIGLFFVLVLVKIFVVFLVIFFL